MSNRFIALLVSAITSFSNHSLGETVYTGDFYFEVPTGWIEIPSSIINQSVHQAGFDVKYDFGYQRDPVESIPVYPYLLGKKIDIPLQSRKADIHDYARLLSGLSPDDITSASSPEEVKSALKSLKVQKVVVDSARQMFFIDASAVKEGLRIRTRAAYIKSNSEILILTYNDLEAGFDRNASTRDSLFESLACKSKFSGKSAPSLPDKTPAPRQLNNFRSRGHSKAKGMDFRISYPNGWLAKEGNRPNVVQKFVFYENEITHIVGITVTNSKLSSNTDQTLSPDQYANLLTHPNSLPPTAFEVQLDKSQLEGIPTASRKYLSRPSRAGSSLMIKTWETLFLFDGKEFSITCTTGGVGTPEMEVKNAYTRTEPVFQGIVNSFVLFNLYEK